MLAGVLSSRRRSKGGAGGGAGGVVKGYSAGGGAGGVVKGYSAGGGGGAGGIVKGYSAGGVVEGYSAGGRGGIVKGCRRRRRSSRRCIRSRSISGESRMRWWCKHCSSTAHGADAVINRLRSAPPVQDRANLNPPLTRR